MTEVDAVQITSPGRRHKLPPGVVPPAERTAFRRPHRLPAAAPPSGGRTALPAAAPPTGGRTAFRQDPLPGHSKT
ncbi:hypothetical protein [Arthrobacter sp. 131MFCol6.1]|uniref:hypothetical protein n=1 Tax=Arthrobacter sp. 131MFCol6.1 TaxID=1157944 RepID=UPI00035D570E|nr:hypothetical protein [Arthrobacter sp. 131MFCol6.1]